MPDYEYRDVSPLKVLLDPDNPRFEPQERGLSQEGIREVLCRRFKLDDLGESIVASGYTDLDPIVTYEEDDRLVVREGNRRIGALQLLLDPGLAPPGRRSKWKELAQELGETELEAVRFGVPKEPSWPTPIAERIEQLAAEMGLDADDPVSKVEATDGDIGLDVATRIRLGDEEAGTGILLTQCATGRNFNAKKGEPALDEWKTLIRWRSNLVRGMAFPWRRNVSDHRLGRLAVRFEAILFDRHRLNSGGNADGLLADWARGEFESWCTDRIAEFPRL